MFLGAGASCESGIPLAGAMMEDFRRRICEEEGPTNVQPPINARGCSDSSGIAMRKP